MSGELARTDIESNAELFRVLGHETRLRLLSLLLTLGEHAVGELDTVSGIGQPALSQQLAILRKAQLVTTRRVVKQVYYRVNSEALRPAALLLAGLAEAAAAPVPRTGASGGALQPTVTGSAASFARML
jgi:DNA-binding transcriptional ArsR family regulator